MDNKFYNGNFENFLKESTEDFKMYPSHKVWTSLYNNLHPAKKWPSVAMLLVLISSIMFIGVSNRKEISKKELLKLSAGYPYIASEPIEENTTDVNLPGKKVEVFLPEVQPVVDQQFISEGNPDNKLFSFYSKPENTEIRRLLRTLKFSQATNENFNSGSIKNVDSGLYNQKINEFVASLNNNDNDKFSFEFYATPSIGYRIHSNNESSETFSKMPAGYLENTVVSNLSNSLNIEAGGNILYSINDNFRLKAGLQLNYTNYYINTFEAGNSSLAEAVMNDMIKSQPVLNTRNSDMSNIPQSGNQVTLNNNTYQLSVPIGADFKIAGNSSIEWYAGASVQPTYVAGGNAYLISSESNSFVNEGSALRRFNLNGGIETFVSYKLRQGLKLNAGPQFRYQFLSTYSNKIMLNEKLYNMGLKLGITTNF